MWIVVNLTMRLAFGPFESEGEAYKYGLITFPDTHIREYYFYTDITK